MRGAHGGSFVAAAALATCLLVSAWAAPRAEACSCRPQRPEDAAHDASAIFEGRVTSFERGDPLTGKPPRAELRVVRVWKGLSSEQATVTTGYGDADCGFGFRVGESYLLYALGSEGTLRVSSCSRSRPIDQAGEDLAVLGMGTVPFSPRKTEVGPVGDAVVPPGSSGCGSCSVAAQRGPASAWGYALAFAAVLSLRVRKRRRARRR